MSQEWLPLDEHAGQASAERLTSEAPAASLTDVMDQVRMVAGFPRGAERTIRWLSLPPYFAACPNPFVQDLLGANEEELSSQDVTEAYASDVAVGKNDPLYFLHYYSTKVPPDAIIPLILHYTRPGEVVLDGFCGTGMTGVAAQLCDDPRRVAGRGEVGARRAILSDLCPSAAFIAAGTNAIGVFRQHLGAIEELVEQVEADVESLLETSHTGWPRGTTAAEERVNRPLPHGPSVGRIEYVVWSDVFFCSSCAERIVFWDLVFRGPKKAMPKESPCPHCGSLQSIRVLERAWRSRFDPEIGQVVRQAEQVPVLINYRAGGKRFEKKPDERDISVIDALDEKTIMPRPPIVELPSGFNTAQPRQSHGFTHVHHFFTRRNLSLLTHYWHLVRERRSAEERFIGLYVLTGALQRVCRLNRYMPNHDRHVGPLSGTLYVAPITAEIMATSYLTARIEDIKRCKDGPRGKDTRIGVQSASDLRNVEDNSVDFIFTDPPFGGNLNYSELNTIVEAWLEVQTDSEPEAIVNDVQKKGLPEYQDLISRCFEEYARVLRPGRWMVVEFHNSSNGVWTTIQEAIGRAGFVVADVRTLDKKKGTTKQLSYASTVKQDLVISAYKPSKRLEEKVHLKRGAEDAVWEFVWTHLKHLPVFVSRDGTAEVIAERQNYLLFDRMVAFHVQRGVTVPMSAAEFYQGLERRLPERDGMYFLPEQAAEYDRKRASVAAVAQTELFVKDEESAIQWVKQQLSEKPQTFQELQPQFMRELSGWERHEKQLELSDLLEENFLCYDGNGQVPSQIHSYLSSNFKDMRSRGKGDRELQAKAKGRWYVPDPRRAGDLEKLRERALLKEFEEYRTAKKKLSLFRLEAVRAGFKRAWQDRDYSTIVAVAEKIPERVLHEDPKLLMWYDQAVMRRGDG